MILKNNIIDGFKDEIDFIHLMNYILFLFKIIIILVYLTKPVGVKYNKDKISFIHFETNKLCNEVMNYILSISKIIDIKIISNTCSRGKKLGYFMNHKSIIKYIIQKRELNKIIICINKCNICYDFVELIQTCKKCNNYVCFKCFIKLLLCPYCRTILRPNYICLSNDICPFRFLMKELK